MKLAIHQPHYLPWLGYLAKWAEADLLVFLDTVQYEKNGWQNRNRIKLREGARWLTVPVQAPLGTPIRDVRVDTRQPWRRRHAQTIEHAYREARHFPRYRASLVELYERDWAELLPLAIASAEWLAGQAGITTPTRLASELHIEDTDATGRLVALCRSLGADTYLAGRDGARYMDLEQFRRAGIAVRFQDYQHPVYDQLHGEFVPFLSALDLLLTHGDDALPILRKGDAWLETPEPQ